MESVDASFEYGEYSRVMVHVCVRDEHKVQIAKQPFRLFRPIVEIGLFF